MYRSPDWTEVRTAIMKQGALVLADFLDRSTIDEIEREIDPWRRQVNFNEIYGSTILGANRWLHHLGIVSLAAMRLALDEKILDLMESIFGEPAILSQVSYQEKIRRSRIHLKMHSDFDGGILAFFYLSGVDDELGSTRYLPETHEIGASLQTRETVFIDEEHVKPRMGDLKVAHGGPGTVLFFDQDIWHDLPPVAKPGRRVVWSCYQPQSRPECAYDHLYRQSILAGLTDRQRRAFGIGQPPFTRLGRLATIGFPLSLDHVKFALQYFMWHRHVSKSSPSAKGKMTMYRPPRNPRQGVNQGLALRGKVRSPHQCDLSHLIARATAVGTPCRIVTWVNSSRLVDSARADTPVWSMFESTIGMCLGGK